MYHVYEIVDDDTLESIALKSSVSVDELCRLNGIGISDFVSGKFIVVPNNELYSTYIVKSGDTLYEVSRKFNIDLDVLSEINGLDDGDYIYPNQELILPNNDVLSYFTKEGDTVNSISNLGVSYNYLSNLALVPGQLIVYKRD